MKASPSTRLTVVSCASGAWGAEKSLSLITRSLADDHGYDVELVCHSDTTARFWRERAASAAVVVPCRRGRLATAVTFGGFLLRERRGARRADIVLIGSLDLVPLVALRVLLRRTTFVIDLHDCPRHVLTRVITAFAASCAHRVVAVSDFIASFVSRSRVDVIGRPIEAVTRRAHRTDGAGLRVGVTGRIDPLKQIELVVDACRDATSKPTLVLRGAAYASENGYSASLLAYATEQLGERFAYEGVVPLAELYDDLDVIVLANDAEPSGTTVGEARAAGVFVVVPDRGGASEWVDDGRNGFVFEARRVGSLAGVLDRCADDEAFRAAVAHIAADDVSTTNSPAVIGDRYHKVLATVGTRSRSVGGPRC